MGGVGGTWLASLFRFECISDGFGPSVIHHGFSVVVVVVHPTSAPWPPVLLRCRLLCFLVHCCTNLQPVGPWADRPGAGDYRVVSGNSLWYLRDQHVEIRFHLLVLCFVYVLFRVVN